MAYPSTLPSYGIVANGEKLSNMGGVGHLAMTNTQNADILALATKAGTGADTPGANEVFAGDSSGISSWRKIVSADITDGTITAKDTASTVIVHKNRLFNGGMRVVQRATLGSTDNSYTLDRWRVLMEAANACVVTQETSNLPTTGAKKALKLTVGSANNNKFGIFQPLEQLDSLDLRSKVASLQALMIATSGITDVRMAILESTAGSDAVSADPISAWNAAGTNPTLTGWTYVGTPVNLNFGVNAYITSLLENQSILSTTNNLAVFIWCDDKTTTTTTDFLIITDTQLEEGPHCTSIERRPYALELMLCQRYFFRLEDGGSNGVRVIAWGTCTSTTTARVYTFWPTTMRTIPSLAFNATKSQYAILNPSAGYAGTVSNVATVGASPHSANIEVTTSAGLTAGDSTALVGAGATSAFIEASAEL